MTLSVAQLGPFGVRMVQALEPWLSEDLERLSAAIGAMGYNALLELVEEEGQQGTDGWIAPWGKLLNVELCPQEDLPYLGQYVGTTIPVGASEAEARALISEQPQRLRGTQGWIETLIYKHTTLEKTSQTLVELSHLVERTNSKGEPDAYAFGVLVPESKVPSKEALQEALKSPENKPAGVWPWFDYSERSYAVLEAAHTTYAALEAAHATYVGLEDNPTK